MSRTVRAVDESLFHGRSPAPGVDAPVLAGSRCATDGTVVFPAQESCPRCSERAVTRVALPGEGTLWSWTVQHFPPKPPYRQDGTEFAPFPVGYVDLGDVIVEARLAGDPAGLRIGMPMRSCWLRAWSEPGGDVVGFGFAPASSPGDAS
jgi:uncharacterized OB-fold protein